MKSFFNYPITIFYKSIENLGRFFLLNFLAFKTLLYWRENLTNILNQMITIGIKSIPIVIFTSLFSGMVAGLQAAYQFDIDTGFPVTKEAIQYLGNQLRQYNILNSKLLLTDKLFKEFALSNEQRQIIVETLIDIEMEKFLEKHLEKL